MKRRRTTGTLVIGGALFVCVALVYFEQVAQPTQNPIQLENAKAGTTDWNLDNPSSSREIEGYASAVRINRGESIRFFVSTSSPSYTLEIFRMGSYGGAGGRRITLPVTLTGNSQTTPTTDATTGITECNWSFPYTVTTSNADPSEWVSGFYLVKLTASSGKQRYIPFVVRDDSRSSDLVFNVSMNTYEAYNAWPCANPNTCANGKSLYTYNSSLSIPTAQMNGGAGFNSAVKVSFNRPYDDGWGSGQFLSFDFNMIGFLEAEGYDVTYQADLDTHLNPTSLLQHKGYMSVGHDEYWTLE